MADGWHSTYHRQLAKATAAYLEDMPQMQRELIEMVAADYGRTGVQMIAAALAAMIVQWRIDEQWRAHSGTDDHVVHYAEPTRIGRHDALLGDLMDRGLQE